MTHDRSLCQLVWFLEKHPADEIGWVVVGGLAGAVPTAVRDSRSQSSTTRMQVHSPSMTMPISRASQQDRLRKLKSDTRPSAANRLRCRGSARRRPRALSPPIEETIILRNGSAYR